MGLYAMDGMNGQYTTNVPNGNAGGGEMYGQNGMYGGSGAYGYPYPYPPVPDEKQVVKSARKHFALLGGMFLVGTIIIYVLQIGAMLGVEALKPEWLLSGDGYLLVSMLPMYLLGMPLLILLVKLVPADKVRRRQMKPGQFAVAAIMCYALMYIFNILGTIMTTIIGILKGGIVQNQLQNITESVSMWVLVLFTVICAPIMEEFVFRKLIVERTIHYGQGVAVLLSGLMFGLFHGNLNQFVYAFALGTFLAFLYVKTGKLKITIALHMMVNFVGGAVATWVTKQIDLDEYMEVASEMDPQAMVEYFTNHLGGWALYALFLCFIFVMIIAGGILIIVSLVKRKFTFERGAVVLPKGKRFTTVILNVGMILYCLFWIGMIIWQLLM